MRFVAGASEITQDFFAGDLLVLRDLADDLAERSDPHWGVGWDHLLRAAGSFGPQHDVIADLLDPGVLPMAADVIGESVSADVAWEFHATASTSSRRRCRRTCAGLGSSS